MNMEEIENYITELESIFELSELEEHSRNILKVGIYIKQLQQENQKLKYNWNKIEQIIENERMSHWAPSPLFLTELLSKMQELEKSCSNE